jgi:hypothetical protein
MEGEPLVGGWLQIHQPEVLPPYFAARKKNLDTRYLLVLKPLFRTFTDLGLGLGTQQQCPIFKSYPSDTYTFVYYFDIRRIRLQLISDWLL